MWLYVLSACVYVNGWKMKIQFSILKYRILDDILFFMLLRIKQKITCKYGSGKSTSFKQCSRVSSKLLTVKFPKALMKENFQMNKTFPLSRWLKLSFFNGALPGMLFQVLQSTNVFLFEFLSTGRCVSRMRLAFDSLRYKFVQRLFETFEPILPKT